LSESSFGRYRLLELLGQGGMGQVYRAYDTATDRIVALKVLPPHDSDDPVFQQRFRREAHTAAGLTDPHVVPIHGYGESDGRLYLDMRLIEGRSLDVVLKSSGMPLDPDRAVSYIEQVAEALNAAHEAGLVHRDVKPSNILITPRDFVYLIDFGIAHTANETRLTGTGHAIGTFAYMAPERISAGQNDPRADTYALACVLHECLTGQPPFGGDSVEQQIAAHLMTAPPRPSGIADTVPASFDAVIERGMAKDPDARYPTALELADAAREALTASHRGDSMQAAEAPTEVADHQAVTTRRAEPASTHSAVTRSEPNPPIPGAPPRPLDPQVFDWTPQRADRKRAFPVAWVTLVALTAVVALAAIAAGIILSDKHSSDRRAATNQSTSPLSVPSSERSEEPTPTSLFGAGTLPPFQPPAGLGTNCQYEPTPAEPAAKPVTPPRAGTVPTNPANVSMSITTNQGPLGVQLDNGKAPCTVNSFVSLAAQGYFNGTHCHRLTTGPSLFVLQCGDPKGDGTGGPGYQFADEYPTNQYPPNDPARNNPVVYPRGTLAMANAGPATNGSQFFIVYKDSELPPDYTVFGTVDPASLAVLDKIAAAGTVDGSPDGKPKTDVVITSARLD
jgi:eukaryotic-like serine/threonine-protein kinase